MGSLGMQEILIILVIALLIIGPNKLPDLAKALGRALAEFRRATDELKRDLNVENIIKVDEIKDTAEDLKKGLEIDNLSMDDELKVKGNQNRDYPPEVDKRAEKGGGEEEKETDKKNPF